MYSDKIRHIGIFRIVGVTRTDAKNQSIAGEMQGQGKRRKAHMPPAQAIALSFALMIFIGAGLLCLPFASVPGVKVTFLDALFTATSANCVTGLVVLDTATTWTWFGRLVIIVLIQLGGVGFFTVLNLSAVLLRQRVSLRNRLVVLAMYNEENIGGIGRLLRNVLKVTLVAEGIGAVLLTVVYYFQPVNAENSNRFLRALVNGLFHSVSAFCNAGFDILGQNSLMDYVQNPAMNLVISALIISGGLGFVVWTDIAETMKKHKGKRLRRKLAHLGLHSKLAITVTVFWIFFGAAAFFVMEYTNPATLGALPLSGKVQAAFFQSITLRTCGFATIDQAGMFDASKFFSSILMMVGGSPASTAGGFKTVTLAVLAVTIFSLFKGRDHIEAFGRTLPLEILQKVLTVFCTMVAVVIFATFALTFTEYGQPYDHNFLNLFFEAASAAGTVGLTTGVTPNLTVAGRIVVVLCMYIGRLSPVTMVVALTYRKARVNNKTSYPEENVVVG